MQNELTFQKKRTGLLIAAALLLGATVATAGDAKERSQSGLDKARKAVPTAELNEICKMGFDFVADTDPLPNDDTPKNNPPVLQVQMKKPCEGTVLGLFTAEILTADGGEVLLVMDATCTAAGGFANACTPGERVFADPGATEFVYLQRNILGTQTHAMNMVWPNLKRGVWRFRVRLSGGDDGATPAKVGYRSFIVQAFEGGPALPPPPPPP